MLITKQFTFASAHKLINYEGKCKNLHGHTYTLRVTVQGEVDGQTGMVIDFNEIKDTTKSNVLDILDHAYLNDIVTQPTAENLAIWVWSKLENHLQLFEIKLWETPESCVVYNGK